MQALPMVLAAGGKLVQGVGALKAGNANRRALYGQAREVESTAAAQELRIRDTARKAIGEQVAAQFGNGMLGGTGSALDALAESQVNAMLDVLQVRRESTAKAMSLRAQGDQARTEGRFALASSILGAASSAAGMGDDWAQAKRGTIS